MHVSGGLAIAAGLFAWLTIPVTLYWVAVELTVGVLWFAATMALRTGRPSARIAAAVLCVISIPLTGIMLILLSLFAATWPGHVLGRGKMPLNLCITSATGPTAVTVMLPLPTSRRDGRPPAARRGLRGIRFARFAACPRIKT